MSTWGVHTFENTAALEWVRELRMTPDLVFLINPLLRLEANPTCMFAPCEEALAAAEVIAASLGVPAPTLPADLEYWARQHPFPNVATFVPMASHAVKHMLTHSWLKDFWSDQGHLADWCKSLLDLETRLEQVAQPVTSSALAF